MSAADPIPDDPEQEAFRIIARWSAAFAASDVDAIVGLYAPDALFLGTGSRTIVTDAAPIRRYFEAALLKGRPRGAAIRAQHAMVLAPDAVLVTALDETTRVEEGTQSTSPGRVTFVIARRGPDWKIVHFHRSAMPK